MMLLPILDEIQSYTRAVERNQVRCDVAFCPCCGEAASFRLHERRRRTYLVVLERLVKKVVSLLTRWRCDRCRKRFTLYPPFALPRKRYLKEEVFRRATRYLERHHESYRGAVKTDSMAVFHVGEGEGVGERTLAHSSLHRWLTFLGSLPETCRRALGLIREKAPASGIFRKFRPIAPWKYRSDGRRRLLGAGRLLLRGEEEYRRLFGISIFPRLATTSGWR